MNKKYGALIAWMLFFSQFSFAAQNVISKEELIRQKQALENSYALLMLNLAGIITGAVAVGAGAGAISGAIGAEYLFNDPTNINWFGVRNASYLEMLKELYITVPTAIRAQGTAPEPSYGYRESQYFMKQFPSVIIQKLAQVGLVAPLLAPISLIFGGISRYLFKKAASYKAEIDRLQAEIDSIE